MKNFIKYFSIVLFLFYGSYSCTFENEEEYFGACNLLDEKGDTMNIYYEDIQPIFEGICAQCHNTSKTPRVGIVLDSYENVKNSFGELVQGTTTPQIIRAIKHEGPYKMPYNQPKLSYCEIEKIEIWYYQGMLKQNTK